jgi:murein peptide amidase A
MGFLYGMLAALVLSAPPHVVLLGHSAGGRPIRAVEVGDPLAARRVLVVGCIHGTECAGIRVVRDLERRPPRRGVDLWLVPDLNPDGLALGVRTNARGVDLNRNFAAAWHPMGRRFDLQYSGPRPWSEPETRIARRLVLRLRPAVTIWYHQHMDLVWAWGPSRAAGRRYARLSGMRFAAMPWLDGTAPHWQKLRLPGTSSFVVELPAGPLTAAAAERYARAVLALGGSPPSGG